MKSVLVPELLHHLNISRGFRSTFSNGCEPHWLWGWVGGGAWTSGKEPCVLNRGNRSCLATTVRGHSEKPLKQEEKSQGSFLPSSWQGAICGISHRQVSPSRPCYSPVFQAVFGYRIRTFTGPSKCSGFEGIAPKRLQAFKANVKMKRNTSRVTRGQGKGSEVGLKRSALQPHILTHAEEEFLLLLFYIWRHFSYLFCGHLVLHFFNSKGETNTV